MAQPLTGDFRELVRENIRRDPEFKREMLASVSNSFLEGDIDFARHMMREYIIGDVTFEELARLTEIPPKSLSRMFGPKGNPTSKNLLKVINALSEHEGIRLRVIAEER